MNEIVQKIQSAGIGVIPTDTIFGLVGQALSKEAVQKLYKVKGRSPGKPFIILISNKAELKHFDIKFDNEVEIYLDNQWPGPVSIILPCSSEIFSYLHRGTESLAFRVPDKGAKGTFSNDRSISSSKCKP